MSINAILFDFGMVLSGPPNPEVWAKMKELAGLDEQAFFQAYWVPRDDYDRGTFNSKAYWERVAREAGISLTDDRIAQLTLLDVSLWTEMNAPMVEWVRALHRGGIRTGILSNIGDAMAEGIRAKFDWIGDFHNAIWSHEHNLRKPELEIYAAAAKGLGLPPDQILFIDDKAENIQAAVEYGMQGIVYSSHDAFEREMRERGLGYLLDVQQLTRAV